MDEYYSVIQFLPEPLRTELKAMPPERAARVQEIRLRAGQAVQFTVGGAWQPAQQLLPAAQTALAIGPRMLRSCFAALCCKAGAFLYAGIAKRAAKWAHILAETTVLCKKPLQRLRFWRQYAIITYNVCSIPCIQY